MSKLPNQTVLLYDPQHLTRIALKGIVREMGFDVIEKNNLPNTIEYIRAYSPSIVMADPVDELFDEVISLVKSNLIIVSNEQDHHVIRKWLTSGVKCVLTKQCSSGEIIEAIKAAASGRRFFCNHMLDMLATEKETPGNDSVEFSNLTEREMQVLKLIAVGKTTFEIAQELVLSVHTINSHRKNILKKLNLKSPTQLVAFAVATGIVQQ